MKTILFIEDDPGQRMVTERLYQMCQKCFHGEVAFLTANDWYAGLKIIQAGHIDAVILDLTLPPMSMDETLAELRKHSDLPPVVVFTGHTGSDDFVAELRRNCILSGADDFLLKTDVSRHPEILCERVYVAFLRRNRARLNEQRAQL